MGHGFSVNSRLLVSSGTYTYLNAGSEQIIKTLAFTTKNLVWGVWLDFNALQQNGTVTLYYKVDGTNYRVFQTSAFTFATDPKGKYLNIAAAVNDDFKVAYTEGADEGADRAIPYAIFYQPME